MTQRKVTVQGHVREDGTYVRAHTRTVSGVGNDRVEQVRDSLGDPLGGEPDVDNTDAPVVKQVSRFRRMFEGKKARARREAEEARLAEEARVRKERAEEEALKEKEKAELREETERAIAEVERRNQEMWEQGRLRKDDGYGNSTNSYSDWGGPVSGSGYRPGDAFNYEGAGDFKY